MKVINSGNSFHIYDDSTQTYDKLPAQTYVIRFSERIGFYLEKYVDLEIKESKIYGVHNEKIKKVMRSFDRSERSLGVILSGDKGIGKSLFAKMLANKAIEKGFPVIIVDTCYQHIASFIEEIEQEAVFLFDEFDKTFGEVKAKDGEAGPQASLLTLFDGLSGGKRLFVITCNDLYKLNSFIVNRPGRFHYHFRFEYPTAQEIKTYLMDKLPEEQYKEIDSVIAFASKVPLNYDCLRAISFELEDGGTFADIIKDLNIIHIDRESYNVIFCFNNGERITCKDEQMDLFEPDDTYTMYGYDTHGDNIVDFTISLNHLVYDRAQNAYVIPKEDISCKWFIDDDTTDKEAAERLKESGIGYAVIKRKNKKALHYLVG